MAQAAQRVARLVEQLGREGAAAHARAVGLEDAVDLADAVRSHAQTRAGAGAHRVRGGDERIGTEIDVEQRALGTFGQHAAVLGQRVVDLVLAVDQTELLEVFGRLEPAGLQFGEVARIVEAPQDGFVARLRTVVDRAEIGVQQVAHADARAADLVGVGRTDALARGADLRAALRRLVGRVEGAVGRQDQVGLFRDAELRTQVVAAGREPLGLLAEEHGVEHHAVADDIGFAALENARRNRAEDIFFTVELQSMTGVRPSLETSYDLIRGGQHIDHLAFAFVAPLQAENDVYFFHFRLRNIICKKHFLHPKVGIFLQKPNSAAHIFAPRARPSPRRTDTL